MITVVQEIGTNLWVVMRDDEIVVKYEQELSANFKAERLFVQEANAMGCIPFEGSC